MSLTVARRYAQALYGEADQQKCVERVDEDISMIQESLAGSSELTRFFQDPVVSSDKKENVVNKLFGDRVHSVVLSFIKLLIQKGRGNIFPTIASAYQALRDEQLGIVEAHVRSALVLGDEEQAKIEQRIQKMTGQQVRLKTEVDPTILGGLIIRVGDTVYDGSVLHQLGALRGRLENSTFNVN